MLRLLVVTALVVIIVDAEDAGGVVELGDIDVDEAAMDIGAHNDNAAANLGSISLLQMSRSALENDRQAPERSGQSIVEHREMGEIQQNREHRKGASPVALPQDLVGKTEDDKQLAFTLERIGRERDEYWNQWHSMRTTCRLLREQNRDFQEEILTDGHMILLGLEMKITVEKQSSLLAEGEALPQNKYKEQIKNEQEAQKTSHSSMIANRQVADKVCLREQQLKTKYRQLMGQYKEANLHLRWRLAHGCFLHRSAHYCVRVKKWCGKEHNANPCEAEAVLGSRLDTTQHQDARGETSQKYGHFSDLAMNMLQMPAPQEVVQSAKVAVQLAVWPQREMCFRVLGHLQCSSVKSWIRHPDLAHTTVPGQAFLPHKIEIAMHN